MQPVPLDVQRTSALSNMIALLDRARVLVPKAVQIGMIESKEGGGEREI